LINTRRARKVRASIDMPVLEDANSVQVAVMQIMNLILSGRIDTKSAGLLLYALQTASLNLKHTRFEPLETRVIIDPRNVPGTPLGADPWSEEDYEDLEDEEDYDEDDDTEEDEQEDDDEQPGYQLAAKKPVAANSAPNGPPRPASAAALSSSNTVPVTSCHSVGRRTPRNKSGSDCMTEEDYFKTHPPRTEADVDFTQLDDEERAAWRALHPAAKAAMILCGRMPMKGEPPKQGKPWRNPDYKPPEISPDTSSPTLSAPIAGTAHSAPPQKMPATSTAPPAAERETSARKVTPDIRKGFAGITPT
jgi:hypothetical protein